MQMRTVPMWVGNRGLLVAAGLILSAGLSAGLATGLFTGLTSVLSTGSTAAFADAAVPGDRRLPKNVVAYLSVRNVQEFKSQWSHTQCGRMIADDALQSFRNDFVKQVTEAAHELCDDLGMSLSELLSIPQGEVTLAATVQPGGTLNWVALLDFGEQAAAMRQLGQKYAAYVKKNDFTCQSEKCGDTNIVSYQAPPADANDHPRDAGAWFVKGSMLVVGSDPATVGDVLTRWDGKQDGTLSENGAYRGILDKCRSQGSAAPAPVTWFFDPCLVLQRLAAEKRESLGQGKPAVELLSTLGIEKFKGVGGVFEMGRGEFDTVSRTFVMLERTLPGLVNLLEFEMSAQVPPTWVSADWTSYKAINWNTAKGYAAIENLADLIIGPGALGFQIQQFADNPASRGLHLKKDLIDQLTGTVHAVELEGENEGKIIQGSLLAVAIQDVVEMQTTLAKIAELGLMKFTEREFQGQMFYEIESAGASDDATSGTSEKSGIAIVEGHVLLASDVRLLERVLRGVDAAEALADSRAYKRVASRFPPQTAYIGFSRQDVQMKSLFDALKTAPPGLVPGLERFDFSKLPDADVLKKYLPATGSYMQHDLQGLLLTTFSLRHEAP